MPKLSPTQLRHLKAVAAYEERYGKRMWAGRDGTKVKTLDSLVKRGLLDKERGEYGLRWWYGLTQTGREALES